MDLVSIIIPVYNIEKYLPRCIETVLAQTYRDLEIILVDDGSTDGTAAICDDFAAKEPRVRVIHKANGGVSSARNVGLQEAKGEYIMFLDGDDYVHREFVSTLYNIIQQDGGYDLALSSYRATNVMDEDTETSVGNVETQVLDRDLNIGRVFGNSFNTMEATVMWNKLFRRCLVEGMEFRNYKPSEDMEYMFRVYLKTDKVIYTPAILYNYVQRRDSTVHSPNVWNVYYLCRLQIDYNLFMELPADRQQYAYYLLRALYRRIAEIKFITQGTDKYAEVCQRCKDYMKDTRKAYWRCKDIRLEEKIGVSLMIRFPLLVKWFTAFRRRFRTRSEEPDMAAI